MKLSVVFFIPVMATMLSSCMMQQKSTTAFTEGISGRITYSEGNMMPGPGQKNAPKGVQRTVYVYAVAAAGQATGQGPLYASVLTPLIATVKSDTSGFYACRLKPGKYSVFTGEEGGMLFSGLSNEKNELSPVEVLPGKVTAYPILINYKAVY